MLIDEIKNIKSEKKDLRNFGLTIGIVLGLLSGLLWWKGRDTYLIMAIIAAAFLLVGLILPFILKPLQKIWMTIAVIIGWFMTRVILTVLFYVIFTCIGWLSKLFGKKYLDVDFKDGRESYWMKKKLNSVEKSRYEKQF
jgi:small basic protein